MITHVDEEAHHETYVRLREHLDGLPGGYPATESGIELRILRRLFTPEEAGLAPHLTLLPEESRVIAHRAGLPVEKTAQQLETMAEKGLIFSVHRPGRSPQYQASQFAVGIWEWQLNKMDEGFIRDMEEYWPTFFDLDEWARVPQVRTIPVNESLDYAPEVMSYEQAETLIDQHDKIAVASCVCRQEQTLIGQGCDKPQETCLSFDGGADYYVRHRMGRYINREEAMDIIHLANEAGLVLQPSNSKKASFICACCGCCCGVLRNIKRHPQPATIVSAPFIAALNEATCVGCGVCVDRCQMEALEMADGKARLDPDRCIGCGLCVSTCPTHALTLERKPKQDQPHMSPDMARTMIRLGQSRGYLKPVDLVKMVVKSQADRLLSK
jgi:Na+-translocating ferredoxin:NAD+ oxidoreductase subunit B